MSTIFSNELEIDHTNSISLDSSIPLASQSTAYGLDLGEAKTNTSVSLGIEAAPERIATSLESSFLQETKPFTGVTSEQAFLNDLNPALDSQAAINSDDLTGIDNGEALLLNLNNATNASERVYGDLFYFDDFNPTRLYAYKDDYLLTSPISGNIQINLDSSEFDAYLQLVNVNTGGLIAFDDDGGIGTNAQLSFTAQAGGQYLIRATSYSSFEVGSYSLTAHLDSGGEPAPPIFDSAYGYGLVDAASAVADAIGQSRFDDVVDIGGVHWNNDMVYAPEVWAQGYTGEGVTVAVIDSGVDIFHEDLIDNIWVNTDELVGDGVDNDGNGYIDDYVGWNFGFGQNNNDILPGTNTSNQGHGTHVAGTIAAANNGIGMTGVAHNADIMAIRMGDVDENGRFVNGGDLAQAVRYAVDNGADVINISLSWSDTDSLRDALAYAASHDVIAVMAAGNDSRSSPNRPASYATDYGISVGAVDINGNITSFSNQAGDDSRMHHVMAPGQDIYSTLPNNSYTSWQGTSMAAPHVAGVIALMLSANPNLTHDQVREILTDTATLSGTTMGSPAAVTAGAEQVEHLNHMNSLIGRTFRLASSWDNVNAKALSFDQALTDDGDMTPLNLPEGIAIGGSQLAENAEAAPLAREKKGQIRQLLDADGWLASFQSLLAADPSTPFLG